MHSRESESKQFEDATFQWLAACLENGSLGLQKDCVTLRQHTSLETEDRSHPFDITLEVRTEANREPILTWIWECKHTFTKVSTEQVERFWLSLVALDRPAVKASIVTTTGYTMSAQKLASRHEIGLLVLTCDDPTPLQSWHQARQIVEPRVALGSIELLLDPRVIRLPESPKVRDIRCRETLDSEGADALEITVVLADEPPDDKAVWEKLSPIENSVRCALDVLGERRFCSIRFRTTKELASE